MKLKVAGPLAVLLLSLSCAGAAESGTDELKPRTSPVQVGEKAPAFTLEDQHQRQVSPWPPHGKMPAVLVFYRGHW